MEETVLFGVRKAIQLQVEVVGGREAGHIHVYLLLPAGHLGFEVVLVVGVATCTVLCEAIIEPKLPQKKSLTVIRNIKFFDNEGIYTRQGSEGPRSIAKWSPILNKTRLNWYFYEKRLLSVLNCPCTTPKRNLKLFDHQKPLILIT